MKYAIRQSKKGESSSVIAKQLGVTTRRIQQLVKQYNSTNTIPVLKSLGRKTKQISKKDVKIILDEYKNNAYGPNMITARLQLKGMSIREQFTKV